MSSDDVRKRLEALNRAPLKNVPPPQARRARAPGPSDLADIRPQPVAQPAAGVVTLTDALPGSPTPLASGRCCWSVQRDPSECGAWTAAVIDRARAALSAPRLAARLRRPGASVPTAVLVDIETLGLTTAEPLFLVGTLRLVQDEPAMCRQALARDLSEESAVLEWFGAALATADVLVSFNGISFDMAMIHGRAAIHDVALPPVPPHVDVLLDARVRYGRRLPNCRLMTLEQRVCGRTRSDDVPGHEVPGVYSDYLRTGDASGLARVARHNVLDLLTTADLFARFYGV